MVLLGPEGITPAALPTHSLLSAPSVCAHWSAVSNDVMSPLFIWRPHRKDSASKPIAAFQRGGRFDFSMTQFPESEMSPGVPVLGLVPPWGLTEGKCGEFLARRSKACAGPGGAPGRDPAVGSLRAPPPALLPRCSLKMKHGVCYLGPTRNKILSNVVIL